MNTPLLTSLGYRGDEVIGLKRIPDLLAPGGKIFYDTHLFPMIRMHGEFSELSFSFRAKNGDTVPVLVNAKVADGAGEGIVVCVAIGIDNRNRYERELIEARRAAEESLRRNGHLQELREELEAHQENLEKRLQHLAQQNTELRQINSVLAHDVQEPLRKIALFSKMLLEESRALSLPRWSRHLTKITQSAESMREMMSSIREFIDVGEREPEPAMLSLSEVFAEAKQNTSPLFEDLAVKFLCADAPVYADPVLLTRLFSELLANSAQFRDRSKPAIEISVRADMINENLFRETDDRYRYLKFTRIRYTDNGVGFPSKYNEEVFLLFRKAHLLGEGQGQGVGLPICRKIAILHHGTFKAASQQGAGTTFTLLLPPAPDPGENAPEPRGKQSEATHPVRDGAPGDRTF